MRLWLPGHGFDLRTQLTKRLPDTPAAVPLYNRRRTRVLALDLDAKSAGPAAVLADRHRIIGWLNELGASFISDRSTSGGAHVWVPLARAVTLDEVRPVLAAIAARCPTLDSSPMLHPQQGALTAPGSRCREGGWRILDGTLPDAAAVLAQRNRPELFALLVELLGAHSQIPAPASPPTNHQAADDVFEGILEDARLRTQYRLSSPLPAAVDTFASTGVLPADRRWSSRSEARQSVLFHAAWRGMSLTDIRDHMTVGAPWGQGLAVAYHRYGTHQDDALARDWAKAQRFVAEAARKVQTCTHRKQVHTGGTGTPPRYGPHQRWLSHASRWCDTTFRSHTARWTVAAVLQALASAAVKAGEIVDGVPVVGVGGRSLSIGAGLISETTVWSTLRMLREMPGSPVLLVSAATGMRADRYALTTPDVLDPDPTGPGRPTPIDVHPVWSAIGLRHRRLYELIVAGGPDGVAIADLVVSARMSRASAFDGVAELARVGLISRRRGQLTAGTITVDELGESVGVFEERAARITCHQASRAVWREWLACRRQPPCPAEVEWPPARVVAPQWTELPAIEHQDYLMAVMAHGPPRDDL
ncbi:hypothetical protein ACWDTP_34055 [Mycobacterium sp. NPDC003449]